MWTSLRSATSGMLAQQRALDVAADNLSKMQVPGSKSQRAEFLDFAPELRYFGVQNAQGGESLEAREVGRGARAAANLQNLSQGMLTPTGDPMDVAINGDGMLEVTLASGQTAYARGGSLRLDGQGHLVTSTGAEVSPSITVPAGTGQ